MVRRIALLATLLLCHCGGCSGCGDHGAGGAPVSSAGPDAAARDAASATPVAPGAERPATSASSRAAVAADASMPMPVWPPQGPGCAAFAACCEAAGPQPAARTVCMLSFNESRDCTRARASFVRKLKLLNAPLPEPCR